MKEQVIVCVDDENIVLNSLEMQLRRLSNGKVLLEFAESAADALELIETLNKEGKEVTLLISDWLMPGMKGDELLAKVHVKYPKIKKVLLTGQADANAKTRVTAIPGLVLNKPWKEQDIKNLLVYLSAK